mmetsp:Transcript_13531/g.35213  ORF Transcript_13531/g.35213 Transcript_13531/m.35213 type:complete len:320 (-) Transcript_13531:86-1045(-)
MMWSSVQHGMFYPDVRPTELPRMQHLDAATLGIPTLDAGADEAEVVSLIKGSKRSDKSFFNGDHYVGDTAGGKRNGHGAYYYQSGDKYVGQWRNGVQCGQGVYTYSNGDSYNGGWRDGKHHGKGSYYFKSGKVFVGNYQNGMPYGYGVFYYPNGERLEGEWRGDAFPETGIYVYANGDSYGGGWLQGKKHGYGSYHFASGARYQGGYDHGQPHGTAVYVSAAGDAFAEEWRHGERISRKRIGSIGDAMQPSSPTQRQNADTAVPATTPLALPPSMSAPGVPVPSGGRAVSTPGKAGADPLGVAASVPYVALSSTTGAGS